MLHLVIKYLGPAYSPNEALCSMKQHVSLQLNIGVLAIVRIWGLGGKGIGLISHAALRQSTLTLRTDIHANGRQTLNPKP